jgi:CRISPR-associated protein Cmr3
MTAKQWCFEPFDTWFFRESRPLDTISGTELNCLFPPPARTVMGAIRSLIGERFKVNWENYPAQYPELSKEMGGSGDDDFGQLRLNGPFLIYKGQRLYPVPLSLMEKEGAFYYLKLGDPVDCDLGKQVRLPKLDERGAKPLDKAWLTEAGLKKVLVGELPEPSEMICQSKLFQSEPRLGIVRDNGVTKEGLLYQAQHLRMNEAEQSGTQFIVDVINTSRFGLQKRELVAKR